MLVWGVSFCGKLAEVDEGMRMITPTEVLKSPKELQKATEYSVRGVRTVLTNEKSFRTDLLVFLICVSVAGGLCFLSLITLCECALMIYVVFMALIGELINTAIETTVDRISKDYHELSGRAKDIGSAIVFTAFWGAGIVWAMILIGAGLRYFGIVTC